MSPVRKTFVIAFISAVLAAQIYVLVPGTHGRWYWPFLNYPMYSAAREAGEPIEMRRLVCFEPGGTAVEFTYRELHVGKHSYWGKLRSAYPARDRSKPVPDRKREAARRFLADRVEDHFPGRFERLEIQSKLYRMGPRGYAAQGEWETVLTLAPKREGVR